MSQEDTVSISEKFLFGDLIKAVMREVRAMPFAWAVLPEKDQARVIERIQRDVSDAVRKTVQIIAADGRPALVADVDSVMFKDGIKAVLSVAKQSADRHELADSTGKMVLIVLPHVEKHLDGEGGLKPDPDQPELLPPE